MANHTLHKLNMLPCHADCEVNSHTKDLAQQDCIHIAPKRSTLADDLTSVAAEEKVLPAKQITKG